MLDASNQLIGIGDGESPTTAQKNAALALCLVCWPHFSRNTPPSTAARLLRQADPFSRLDPFEGTEATLDLLGPNGGAGATAATGGVGEMIWMLCDSMLRKCPKTVPLERWQSGQWQA